MLKCYIEGRNLTELKNPEQYKIAEGAVFIENGNETLDSGTIILPQLDHKIEIEPYDVIVIFSTSDSKIKINQRRMCVDTYTCTQTSLDPAIYKYEISLFSETKLLEGILCPSLSITKLKTGQRKVWHYLSQYLNEYGTKTAVNSSNLSGTPKFSYAPRVQTKFNEIDCPELQWNEPTLREVLSELMMVADCIPVVRNNVIDYMDLSQEGTDITIEQKKSINYITETQTSQDYVSEMRMNVKNALNNTIPSGEITSYDDVDIPKDASYIIEEIGFKNYETYQLTTERLKLETQLPIWRLFFCELICRCWGSVDCRKNYNGQEIVVNKDFDNGMDDWFLNGGTATSSNGQLTFSITDNAGGYVSQDLNMEKVTGNDFTFSISAKGSVVGELFVRFLVGDTIVHQELFTLSATDFQTFTGSFSTTSHTQLKIEVGGGSDMVSKKIIFESISISGWKYIITSHNFAQNLLLKARKNITPYILEYTYWQTKDIYYAGYNSTQGFTTDYQNCCLYYKRGQKGIFNFSAVQTYKFLWITDQTLVYELMVADMTSRAQSILIEEMKKLYPESEGYYQFTATSTTVKKEPGGCMFRMAYEPLDECTFKASKYPLVRNHREIVDNQTNSYVDINRLGMLEYLKAKRLGNKIKIINGRYKTDENQLPQIFQKIDGSIIFKKEIAVHSNCIVVNYQATENYVLKDYFTSVKSKLRNWRIVSESEAFTRADIFKFYVGKNIQSIDNANVKIPSYTSVNEYLDNFKYCVVQFTTNDGNRPVNPPYNFYFFLAALVNATAFRPQNALMCEFSKHIVGKSVVFTFKMLDNTLAGKYVYNNYQWNTDWLGIPALLGFTDQIGGQQRNIKYTDENGEITGGTIRFFNKIHNPNLLQRDPFFSPSLRPYVNLNGDHSGANQFEGNFDDSDGLVAKIPFTIHKDNKEILQISIQFEISDEATDMFLGK